MQFVSVFVFKLFVVESLGPRVIVVHFKTLLEYTDLSKLFNFVVLVIVAMLIMVIESILEVGGVFVGVVVGRSRAGVQVGH